MEFREFLSKNNVYLDGGMGTLLQERGLGVGELPERWNIAHPSVIKDIHRSYFDAGSNVVATNTFGANLIKFSESELEETVKAAFEIANAARRESKTNQEKFIALDIGPTGKLLSPYGDLDFEDAVSIFAKTVSLGVKYGADLILIETMNDSYETKAALLAAKENSNLPVIVTNAYGKDGKLMTGASPEAMVLMLEGMGADAIGANCSLGPRELIPVMERILNFASVPVVMKPNAGIPRTENGKTVFDVSLSEFAEEVSALMKLGVRVVGGCCGTTPEYIKVLRDETKTLAPADITEKNITAVSSYTHAVEFKDDPILIGERINPTGKKRFKTALIERDLDYVLTEAIHQAECGAHILDVNVGLPEIDEREMLTKAVTEIQSVVNTPLQIDTADTEAMESAIRRYNGKPLINSVNGKAESMEKVFPLVKKYGGTVIALTLDENGIPKTAGGRIKIAKRILSTAEKYGIKKKDIIFDTLVLTISTGADNARTTLDALRYIKNELGVHTSLGISNVSYGLPNRDAVNSTFFALALENGLSAAIMNPYSDEMMKTYFAFCALRGFDENCLSYIANASKFTSESIPVSNIATKETVTLDSLRTAIEKGLKERAAQITAELIKDKDPIDIVNSDIIPALDKVGAGYEKSTVYLPELLMAAEAAKSAFEVIKSSVSTETKSTAKAKVVIATVEGDIHDIGKNIVKLLLENYGFDVTDLGKDVPPEKIAESAEKLSAKFVGLSALMTTTLPAMERTVSLIKKRLPDVKTVVGGAVLTQEYADMIGADKYASDAIETVRYCESQLEILK